MNPLVVMLVSLFLQVVEISKKDGGGGENTIPVNWTLVKRIGGKIHDNCYPRDHMESRGPE